MRFVRASSIAAVGLSLLLGPVGAAVLVPVSVPNASRTKLFGINDNNVIAGSFIGKSDHVEHAFFGTFGGNYSTFDGGNGGTQARAINNNTYITGFSNSQGGGGITGNQPIFERLPDGTILNVTASGQQLYGRAQGINNSENRFTGTYWDFQGFDAVAFVGKNGQYQHDVRLKAGYQASDGEGINSANVIVGQLFEPPLHGFILHGKTLTIIDYPGAHVQGTGLEGINDSGQAVGQWTDNHNHAHSFLLDIATQTLTDIVVPGAKNTEAWNINNNGEVALSSNLGSFIWCVRKKQCPAGGTFVEIPIRVAKRLPDYVTELQDVLSRPALYRSH
jgi:hypothetical protein